MGYREEVLADGPLAYYPLDLYDLTDLAQVPDVSGNARHALLKVNTGQGQQVRLTDAGIPGSPSDARSFWSDSTGSAGGNARRITPPDLPTLQGNAPWTMAVWARAAVASANRYMLTRGQAASIAPVLWLGVESGGTAPKWAVYSRASDTAAQVGATSPVGDDAWHYVAAKFDGTNLILVVDGVRVGARALAASARPTGLDLTGIAHIARASVTNPWRGNLAHAAFYDVAVSDARLRAHYLAGVSAYQRAVLADSPAAYYRLGQQPGSTAGAAAYLDDSGNGRHATVDSPERLTRIADGIAGGAPEGATAFANASDPTGTSAVRRITPPAALGMPSGFGPQTMEGWWRGGSGSGSIATRGDGAQNFGTSFFLSKETNGMLGAYWRNAQNTARTAQAPAPTTPGWHHAVAVIQEGYGSLLLYSDGALIKTADYGHPGGDFYFSVAGVGYTNRAAANITGPAIGMDLDEVAFYPSALSAARILAHYQAGVAAQAVQVLLAGGALTTSGTSAMLAARKALAGAAMAGSGAAGALGVSARLAATAHAASAVVLPLVARSVLGGSAQALSGTQAALLLRAAMGGRADSASATAAELRAVLRIAGSAAGVSGATGSFDALLTLAAAAASASSVAEAEMRVGAIIAGMSASETQAIAALLVIAERPTSPSGRVLVPPAGRVARSRGRVLLPRRGSLGA